MPAPLSHFPESPTDRNQHTATHSKTSCQKWRYTPPSIAISASMARRSTSQTAKLLLGSGYGQGSARTLGLWVLFQRLYRLVKRLWRSSCTNRAKCGTTWWLNITCRKGWWSARIGAILNSCLWTLTLTGNSR